MWPHLALQHIFIEGLRPFDAQLLNVLLYPALELQLQVLLVHQELVLILATLDIFELAHARVHAVLRLMYAVLEVHLLHPGPGGLAVARDDALGDIARVPVLYLQVDGLLLHHHHLHVSLVHIKHEGVHHQGLHMHELDHVRAEFFNGGRAAVHELPGGPPPDLPAEVHHPVLAPPHPIHHPNVPPPPLAKLAARRRPHLRKILCAPRAHARLQALGQLLLLDLRLLRAQGPLVRRKACLGHHLVAPAQARGVARGSRVHLRLSRAAAAAAATAAVDAGAVCLAQLLDVQPEGLDVKRGLLLGAKYPPTLYPKLSGMLMTSTYLRSSLGRLQYVPRT